MRSAENPGRRCFFDDPDTSAAFEEMSYRPKPARLQMLREQVVEAWLPMAHRLAARYRGRGESDEDLRQVAAVGLIKAVDGFDPRWGTPFPGYAVPTILGEIKRHFRDDLWAVHVPRSTQELGGKVRRARQELRDDAADTLVSVECIASRTGLSCDEVLLGLEAAEAYSAWSLDAPFEEGQLTLGDSLGMDDDRLRLVEDREAARPGLKQLPARERHILYLRFFVGMTQAEIAAAVGVSQMQICRLIQQSCARVRELAKAP